MIYMQFIWKLLTVPLRNVQFMHTSSVNHPAEIAEIIRNRKTKLVLQFCYFEIMGVCLTNPIRIPLLSHPVLLRNYCLEIDIINHYKLLLLLSLVLSSLSLLSSITCE